ncbi:ATP-binding protein [Deinococcus sp. SM5_A1]|uniref:sensor histidine kinase n=1 Tax=Deinococcus sp. SM5_A1 TaxID=3379094 RepID=UPI00385ABAE8
MSDPAAPASASFPDELARTRAALAAAERRIEVLSTFMALSEAAATTEDLLTLARHAEVVLRQNIPGLLAAYYERQGERWVARVTTDSMPPDLLGLIQAGLPLDTPYFTQTVAARAPRFFDHWDTAEQGMPFTELFQAVGLAPFFQDGQPVAMLTAGLSSGAVWTSQQQSLFKAVYQAFHNAQQRHVQAEDRQLGLAAFMQLTEEIGAETDRLKLAERARDLLRVSLPEYSVVYYERQGDLWKARLADVPDPTLRAVLMAGLPTSTPGFRAAVDAGEAVFFEHWDAADQAFDHTQSYGAAAFCPYFRGPDPAAMFVIGTQETRTLRPAARAVFLAVGRSLELALERAWQTQDLEEQRSAVQESAARLGHSNEELKAANEELEAFAYSASHDLRTPVRHVKGFAKMVRRAVAGEDPEKVMRALDVIEGAADQMNAMIDAMLGLARSARQPLAHTAVALDALTLEARRNVEDEAGERVIHWQIGALPQVMGDAATLQQVLINLLSNAVKFTRTREQAVIEVGARQDAVETTVWVRDNGVGFDPAYQSRLFGPFQRLHLQTDFEGTGIGLATSRRIILRHGGRIWASSAPDKGTTVSFTLPHLRPAPGEL